MSTLEIHKAQFYQSLEKGETDKAFAFSKKACEIAVNSGRHLDEYYVLQHGRIFWKNAFLNGEINTEEWRAELERRIKSLVILVRKLEPTEN